MTYFDQVAEAANFLRGKLNGLTPRVGVVLGSGLGTVANAVSESVIVSYRDIPHFPHSTVDGHSGRIVAGRMAVRRSSSSRGGCSSMRGTRAPK